MVSGFCILIMLFAFSFSCLVFFLIPFFLLVLFLSLSSSGRTDTTHCPRPSFIIYDYLMCRTPHCTFIPFIMACVTCMYQLHRSVCSQYTFLVIPIYSDRQLPPDSSRGVGRILSFLLVIEWVEARRVEEHRGLFHLLNIGYCKIFRMVEVWKKSLRPQG